MPQLRLRAANAERTSGTTSWRDFDAEDSMRFFALRMHEDGHDQVEPAEDHRRRHRLALPRRAEARAEDLSGQPGLLPFNGRENVMQIIQNRRRFLAGAAAAGAAGLRRHRDAGARRAAARSRPKSACRCSPRSQTARRRCTSARSFCAPKASPTFSSCTSGTGPDSSDWIGHGETRLRLELSACACRVRSPTACRLRS